MVFKSYGRCPNLFLPYVFVFSNISMFKKDEVRILIATSVAARGLDVKNTNLVVNYDSPNHYEDYVHRCGRTGRAGRSGTAYTFITSDQVRLDAL